MSYSSKTFVALDSTNLPYVKKLAKDLSPHFAGIKLGLEFFCAHGIEGVKQIEAEGIFLDLKLHDIPNTVAKAIKALQPLKNIKYVTVHTSGGQSMLKAAQQAVQEEGGSINLLGVTVLTSLNTQDLKQQNIQAAPEQQVISLAKMASAAGLYGVVSSGHEATAIKQHCPNLKVVTPGIRPAGSAINDQQRVFTPQQAIEAGADYLVIGRPITEAADPVQVVQQL